MLLEKLNDAVKEAMKSKDVVTRDTLRGVVADIKLTAKETKHDLEEAEEMAILNKHVKQVKESIDAYSNGNRMDLVQEEQAKLNVLTAFLPQQMSEEEVRALVEKTITDQGLETSNKGLLMKHLMPLFKGKADGKMVNEVIASFVK